MTKREEFIEIFNENIKREGADKLLEYLDGPQSDFFCAPASTRFHGSYEGGLLEHSINVYHCLKDYLSRKRVKEIYNLTYTDESIAIVSLLHDLCKVNCYVKGTRNVKENGQWATKEVYEIDEKFPCGHGEKSVIILQNFIHLEAEEIYAIRAHMGGFDTSVKGGDYFIGNIFERSKLALLLHLADMKATYLLEG